MLPPQTSLDPDGYYDRLGLEPAATRAQIVAAFRAKARVLHPDVAKTGNASAFVAVKQAYDVLSNQQQRAAYDRKSQRAALEPRGREVFVVHRPANPPAARAAQKMRPFDVPIVVWVGLAAFLCLCIYQATAHLLAPPRTPNDDIKPNAPTVAPLSPSAHQAMLYGPVPVQLVGTPNFYVIPHATPAVLWRRDTETSTLVPLRQLPPFSAVQAIRLIRQNGMLEVLVNDQTNGFISADHLTPGDAVAARRAYCGYNSGPTPQDGELLLRRGSGGGTVTMDNATIQPVVVKLRDVTDAVAVAVFLEPGGHAELNGLPEGTFHAEFAIGELWSRACNAFAAGMRTRRMKATLRLPGDAQLTVMADDSASSDIPEQAFQRD